jgi:hypothetical protein
MLEPLNSDLTTACEAGDRDLSVPEVCDDGADGGRDQAGAVIIPFPQRDETVEVSQAVEFLRTAEAQLRASRAVLASVDKQFLIEAIMKMGVNLEDVIEEIASVEGVIGKIGTMRR